MLQLVEQGKMSLDDPPPMTRAGNRQLTSAIYMAAHVQTAQPRPGRTYYEKKLAEGKSRAEARRAPKRQVTKAIYRSLQPPKNQTLDLAA